MAGRDTRKPSGPPPRSTRSQPIARSSHPSGRTRLERVQRTLLVMAITVFAVTAIAIAVLLVRRAMNLPQGQDSTGLLQILAVLPTPGIALCVALIVAIFVVTLVHRSRAAANDS